MRSQLRVVRTDTNASPITPLSISKLSQLLGVPLKSVIVRERSEKISKQEPSIERERGLIPLNHSDEIFQNQNKMTSFLS